MHPDPIDFHDYQRRRRGRDGVTEPHAGRYAGGERTKLLPGRLPDGLESLKPVRPFDRVKADAIGAAEDRHLSILFV